MFKWLKINSKKKFCLKNWLNDSLAMFVCVSGDQLSEEIVMEACF